MSSRIVQGYRIRAYVRTKQQNKAQDSKQMCPDHENVSICVVGKINMPIKHNHTELLLPGVSTDLVLTFISLTQRHYGSQK